MKFKGNQKVGVILLLAAFLIGIIVGANFGGGGISTPATYPLDISGADNHSHTQLDVFEVSPRVDLELIEESAEGKYILNIQTENFTFAPEKTGGDHESRQGHAHVYVDGVKISRAYSSWYDLPKLKPGERTIRVTLNTNDHREYATHGDIIAAEVTVMVATSSEMLME